jgi:uncharacterized protein (DUF2062 family)
LKILLLTFGDQKSINTLKSPDHTFIIKKAECEIHSCFQELKKSAEFAENKGCELIAVIPPEISGEELILLLKSMPDQTIATSMVTSFSPNDTPGDAATNRSITMLQLLTGEKLCGFQNDFRIYPVKLLAYLPEKFFCSSTAYLQILINASRAGYKITAVEIQSENLSLYDKEPPPLTFFIAELLKTLLPFLQKRLSPRNFQKEKLKEFLMHPKIFIKYLLKENTTPGALAMAAATGIFIGTLPIFSFHTVTIIYISIKLRLNKMLSVNMQHLCIPPFVPIACIEIGHYMLHGQWLKTASFKTLFEEIDSRILEWLLGSLILAPVNALVFAAITYIIASAVNSRKRAKNK